MKRLNNNFGYLLISLMIYLALAKYLSLDNFNILSLIIYILIFIVVKKHFFKLLSKRSIILSLIFTLCFTLGKVCFDNIYTTKNVFSEFFTFETLYLFIGIFLLFTLLISVILKKLETFNPISENNFKNNKKLFIISFIVIMVCLIPYFLHSFPGLIAPDAIYQTQQFKHLTTLTDHHPVLHTFFLKVCYAFGSIFSNSENIRASVSTIVQMIIMSSIYSYFIVFLNKHKIDKKILIGLMFLFGLLPVYAFYSITMWKDVMFGGFFLLFLINIYVFIEKKEKLKYYHFISFAILSLLVLFFRNNALYMYILFIPFILVYFKDKIKPFAITLTIVLLCFFVVKYPVFNYFGVEKSKSWEYLGMPIQQVGRMAYKDINFTKEERKTLEKFITIENLKSDYNPIVSDGIKFSLNLNQEYFDSHNMEFLLLWKDLVIEHFDVAVESYLISTLGYWYPNLANNAVELGVTDNDLGFYQQSLLPKSVGNFIDNLYSYNTPILSLQWNLGLIIWFTIILGVVCYRKNKKNLLCYVPIVGMWLTLMIASPVNGMLRYIFWLYTALPLLFFINYLPSINVKNTKKRR